MAWYRPQPIVVALADQAPRAHHERSRSQLRARAGGAHASAWRLPVWILLALVGLLFLASFHVWTPLGFRASIVQPGPGPTEAERPALSAVGTTQQPEPTAPATAPIRDNIREGMPGWDSIRRVPPAKDASAPAVSALVAPATRPALATAGPVVLGLLMPAIGWVALHLALRWSVASWSRVPAGGPDDTPGRLLRALREVRRRPS